MLIKVLGVRFIHKYGLYTVNYDTYSVDMGHILYKNTYMIYKKKNIVFVLVLTWAMYFLASHDDVQERVIEEIKTVLGDEPITFDAVNQLTWVHEI